MDDFALAASLVRAAGALAARMLAEGLRTEHKTSVSDVVSAADHAAEELIEQRLRDARPDDGVIGEEGTSRPGMRTAGTARAARTWYVDPVDGTYNFLSGLPVWCAALALADDAGPLVGAVYQPTTDELWLGGGDVATTHNGRPVPRLVDRPLGQVSVASYLHPTALPTQSIRAPMFRVMERAATVRMLGSGSIELASVASGRLGAWVQYTSLPWDWLPGAALVKAAGGAAEIIPAHGHDWHVAGSTQVVAEIAELLRAG